MRSPAQASVNVLVHEDMGRMGEAAKYKGMQSQLARLRASFARRSAIACTAVVASRRAENLFIIGLRSVAELSGPALLENPDVIGTQ